MEADRTTRVLQKVLWKDGIMYLSLFWCKIRLKSMQFLQDIHSHELFEDLLYFKRQDSDIYNFQTKTKSESIVSLMFYSPVWIGCYNTFLQALCYGSTRYSNLLATRFALDLSWKTR